MSLKDIESRFLDEENFYLAFKKLSYYLRQNNEWYNPVELTTFEANLATNIRHTIDRLKDRTYVPSQMEIMPFPKKNDGKEMRFRQYFRISIEDQLVWIAIVNIIGRFAEEKMPVWSYGNRLFRPVWFEDIDNAQKMRKGSFTSTSSNLYRKWNQSWPFYRRHISMTIKTMAYNQKFTEDLLTDDLERELLQQQQDNDYEYFYLDKEFWSSGDENNIYWATIDFKDFFPSLGVCNILENIKRVLVREDGTPRDDINLIIQTTEQLLRMPINKTGWDTRDLETIGLNKEFWGVPTGLLVSGFLANVAMVEIDGKVNEYILQNRNVAVFKYVDDHTIISNSKSALDDFLKFYHQLIIQSATGAGIHEKKISPDCIKYNTTTGFDVGSAADEDLKLNIDYPEPLMTFTLQKMSQLNGEDFDLMHSDDLEKAKSDLTHFMLADFPDAEMKRETRIAFAATKLCQLGKKIKPDFRHIDPSLHNNISAAKIVFERDGDQKINVIKSQEEYKVLVRSEIQRILKTNTELSLQKEVSQVSKKHQDIFRLLLKAAKENPDKLKLWKRCVEYISHSGITGIHSIFETISTIQMHPMGKVYVHAFTLFIINQQTLVAYNKLVSKKYSYWECYTSEIFLQEVVGLQEIEQNFAETSFYKETLENFAFLKDFVSNSPIAFQVENSRSRNDKSKIISADKYQQFRFSFQKYLYFILVNAPGANKLNLWKDYIAGIDLSDKTAWSILLFFPHELPDSIFEQFTAYNNQEYIDEKVHFMHDASGILYDCFYLNPSLQRKYLDRYPKLKSVFTEATEELRLDGWIANIKLQSCKNSWTDPRLSEWTHLEIIKQIATAIDDKISVNDNTKGFFSLEDTHYLINVHQANYIIPSEWTEKAILTWKEWRELVTLNTITLKSSERFIRDHRYLPMTKYWETTSYGFLFDTVDFSIIVGLSVLLIKLISQSFDWPATSNKAAFIDQLFANALNAIEQQPISSETRKLISTIFSKRDIDFYSGSRSFVIGEHKVNRLRDFIKVLSAIQENLKRYQLDLYDQMPRQLTFIDIDMFQESKDIF